MEKHLNQVGSAHWQQGKPVPRRAKGRVSTSEEHEMGNIHSMGFHRSRNWQRQHIRAEQEVSVTKEAKRHSEIWAVPSGRIVRTVSVLPTRRAVALWECIHIAKCRAGAGIWWWARMINRGKQLKLPQCKLTGPSHPHVQAKLSWGHGKKSQEVGALSLPVTNWIETLTCLGLLSYCHPETSLHSHTTRSHWSQLRLGSGDPCAHSLIHPSLRSLNACSSNARFMHVLLLLSVCALIFLTWGPELPLIA